MALEAIPALYTFCWQEAVLDRMCTRKAAEQERGYPGKIMRQTQLGLLRAPPQQAERALSCQASTNKRSRPACVMHSYSASRQKACSDVAWLPGDAAAPCPPASAAMAQARIRHDHHAVPAPSCHADRTAAVSVTAVPWLQHPLASHHSSKSATHAAHMASDGQAAALLRLAKHSYAPDAGFQTFMRCLREAMVRAGASAGRWLGEALRQGRHEGVRAKRGAQSHKVCAAAL